MLHVRKSNPLSKLPGWMSRIQTVETRRSEIAHFEISSPLAFTLCSLLGCHNLDTHDNDALAERSKAVAQGAIPKGRGFEPHRRHFGNSGRLVLIICDRVIQPTQICKMTPGLTKVSVCSATATDVCFDKVLYEKHDLIGGMAQRQRV